MKQAKKLLSIFLSLCMLLSITAGLDFSSYAKILTSGPYEYIIIDDGTAKIESYNGSGNEVKIPSKIDGYTVTAIGMSAFSHLSVTSVTIPNTVTYLGSYSFRGCTNLKEVFIGNKVKTIDTEAFRGCSSLKSVNIPDSVTLLDNYAFAYCDNLVNVKLSKNLTAINTCAFQGCNISSIIIPEKVVTIGAFAFEYCGNMEKIKIGSKVTKIENWAFYGCYKLKNVYFVGSKTQWDNIYIGKSNDLLSKATKHYNCDCKHTYKSKLVKPTYTSGGYTLHTCTKCKKSYKDKKTKKLVLKNTSISKLTAGKKAFTAKWKKQSVATGYQIQYATDSKFKKNKKTVTISKNKTTSKKVSKLKAKKKYYVRIRTYKTVKANGKNTKVYSSWSKAKRIKTK